MERACPVFRGGFVSAVPLPEQNSTHPMNDTSNLSYPGSRRIYVPGRLYPDVRVPMREILLSDTLLGLQRTGFPPCVPPGYGPAGM